ncbi:MAG TPA: DUF1844 domain-containing protein [Thermoanaerobaculia bacterium]
MPNEKKEIKVTDKRMFTPAGELREEYRFLNEKATSTAAAEPAAAPASPSPAAATRPEPPPPPRETPPREAQRRPPEPDSPRVDLPETPPELGGPSFFDLVAMMAEPVPIYLGDAVLPDGQDATNLEMARFHIDLLAVLRQKTAGNLTAQESTFLEDLLYRLRVRYVQKTRG